MPPRAYVHPGLPARLQGPGEDTACTSPRVLSCPYGHHCVCCGPRSPPTANVLGDGWERELFFRWPCEDLAEGTREAVPWSG